MSKKPGIRLIAGHANRPLAENIASHMSMAAGYEIGLANADIRRYADREVFVVERSTLLKHDGFFAAALSEGSPHHFSSRTQRFRATLRLQMASCIFEFQKRQISLEMVSPP